MAGFATASRSLLNSFTWMQCAHTLLFEEYWAREAHQELVDKCQKKKREAGEITEVKDGQPPRKRHKHDETKVEQQMCGQQLVESGKKYKD